MCARALITAKSLPTVQGNKLHTIHFYLSKVCYFSVDSCYDTTDVHFVDILFAHCHGNTC